MENVVEYKVVNIVNHEAFNKRCNELLDAYWQLHGHTQVIRISEKPTSECQYAYIQAFVRTAK